MYAPFLIKNTLFLLEKYRLYPIHFLPMCWYFEFHSVPLMKPRTISDLNSRYFLLFEHAIAGGEDRNEADLFSWIVQTMADLAFSPQSGCHWGVDFLH